MAFHDRTIDTTTTTGTGNLTLSGAVPTGFLGHRFFSQELVIGETFFYTIEAIDGTGAPTAEFERGKGTYSAANTVQRTRVFGGSNGTSLVNFSAGTKRIFITPVSEYMKTLPSLGLVNARHMVPA